MTLHTAGVYLLALPSLSLWARNQSDCKAWASCRPAHIRFWPLTSNMSCLPTYKKKHVCSYNEHLKMVKPWAWSQQARDMEYGIRLGEWWIENFCCGPRETWEPKCGRVRSVGAGEGLARQQFDRIHGTFSPLPLKDLILQTAWDQHIGYEAWLAYEMQHYAYIHSRPAPLIVNAARELPAPVNVLSKTLKAEAVRCLLGGPTASEQHEAHEKPKAKEQANEGARRRHARHAKRGTPASCARHIVELADIKWRSNPTLNRVKDVHIRREMKQHLRALQREENTTLW